MEFSVHQQNLPTPPSFNIFNQPKKIIQINKNYGQFPTPQHLWVARDGSLKNRESISPPITHMGWLTMDQDGNFQISEIPLADDILDFFGDFMFVEKNMLYIGKYLSEYSQRSSTSGSSREYAILQVVIRHITFDITKKEMLPFEDVTYSFKVLFNALIGYQFPGTHLIIDKDCTSIECGVSGRASIIFHSPTCCAAFNVGSKSTNADNPNKSLYVAKGVVANISDSIFWLYGETFSETFPINDLLLCKISYQMGKQYRSYAIGHEPPNDMIIITAPATKSYSFRAKDLEIPLGDPVVCWS
jgi:hypothetical protein